MLTKSYLAISAALALLILTTGPAAGELALAPSSNLDQVRNGSAASPEDPANWVNGNLNASQAHYLECYSVPYRNVMEELPTEGTIIELEIEFDTKENGHMALDYLTHFDHIDQVPPAAHMDAFGHPKETIDPTDGVTISTATVTTAPIPTPSPTGSPVAGQPETSFLALPPADRVFTLYGGNLIDVTYTNQDDIADAVASAMTSVLIRFTADSETAVLAWGGHIASRADWGFLPGGEPRSAGGISGSPYHMRLLDWNLGNLGNQDRSLQAAAVHVPCGECIIAGPDGPVCPSSQHVFSAPVTGTCQNPMYSWDVTGGTIIGSSAQETVTVEAGSSCQSSFTVSVEIECDGCDDSPIGCQKTVAVGDTAPVITCPASVIIECGESTQPANTGSATATDDCGDPVITFDDMSVPGCGMTQTITRVWTATDQCGNTAMCEQTITVRDDIPPLIVGCPDDILRCTNGPTAVEYDPPTATDDCSEPVTIVCSPPSGSVFPIGTTTVTCTATDACGNTASCQFDVTINENQPPTCDIDAPTESPIGVSVQFDGSGSSDPDGTIVSYAWDFGDGNSDTGPIVSHTYEADGTYTVTLCIVDDCGAEVCCTHEIFVDLATPVELSSMAATSSDGLVTIAWETSMEQNSLGFHIHRAEEQTVAFVTVTERMIAGGGNTTGTYEFVDETATPGMTYIYRLEAIDRFGIREVAGERSVTVARVLPKLLALQQNQPNPFNPTTMIHFELPTDGHVALRIYDTQGRLVRTLVDATLTRDFHSYEWNGRDDRGVQVRSGIYFYRLNAAGEVITHRMVMLK